MVPAPCQALRGAQLPTQHVREHSPGVGAGSGAGLPSLSPPMLPEFPTKEGSDESFQQDNGKS